MPEFASFTTPEKHGAVGNGSTNDGAAWQAAINAANVVLVRRNSDVAYNIGGTLDVPGDRLIMACGAGKPNMTGCTFNIIGSRVKIVGFQGASVRCTTANIEHVTIDGLRGDNVHFTAGGCKHVITKMVRDGRTLISGSNNSCYYASGGQFNLNGEPVAWDLNNVSGFCIDGAASDISSGAHLKVANSVGVADGCTGERNVSVLHATAESSIWVGPMRALRLGSPDAGGPGAAYRQIIYCRDSRVTCEGIFVLNTSHFATLNNHTDVANGVVHWFEGNQDPETTSLPNAIGANAAILVQRAGVGRINRGSGWVTAY